MQSIMTLSLNSWKICTETYNIFFLRPWSGRDYCEQENRSGLLLFWLGWVGLDWVGLGWVGCFFQHDCFMLGFMPGKKGMHVSVSELSKYINSIPNRDLLIFFTRNNKGKLVCNYQYKDTKNKNSIARVIQNLILKYNYSTLFFLKSSNSINMSFFSWLWSFAIILRNL